MQKNILIGKSQWTVLRKILLYFLCSDGETFVSADDLRINLWNLEVSNQCFNIVDMKPSNMDDLTGTALFVLFNTQ